MEKFNGLKIIDAYYKKSISDRNYELEELQRKLKFLRQTISLTEDNIDKVINDSKNLGTMESDFATIVSITMDANKYMERAVAADNAAKRLSEIYMSVLHSKGE